jgi:hypothetical protein
VSATVFFPFSSGSQLEYCFQFPRFLGKKAYVFVKLESHCLSHVSSYLDSQKGVFGQRLEELAQYVVDKVYEVLIGLFSW